MKKKLYVDKSNSMILGVCAGIAKYFNVDTTVVRIICLVLIILTGLIPGILGYIAAGLVMPEAKKNK